MLKDIVDLRKNNWLPRENDSSSETTDESDQEIDWFQKPEPQTARLQTGVRLRRAEGKVSYFCVLLRSVLLN